jgi:hypothetical protein
MSSGSGRSSDASITRRWCDDRDPRTAAANSPIRWPDRAAAGGLDTCAAKTSHRTGPSAQRGPRPARRCRVRFVRHIRGPGADASARSRCPGRTRYNQFHTTALCSQTRASLLTGRNRHAVHMGGIPEIANTFPGYDSAKPREAATVAEILRLHGYSTACFGKWHLTPSWHTFRPRTARNDLFSGVGIPRKARSRMQHER